MNLCSQLAIYISIVQVQPASYTGSYSACVYSVCSLHGRSRGSCDLPVYLAIAYIYPLIHWLWLYIQLLLFCVVIYRCNHNSYPKNFLPLASYIAIASQVFCFVLLQLELPCHVIIYEINGQQQMYRTSLTSSYNGNKFVQGRSKGILPMHDCSGQLATRA